MKLIEPNAFETAKNNLYLNGILNINLDLKLFQSILLEIYQFYNRVFKIYIFLNYKKISKSCKKKKR